MGQYAVILPIAAYASFLVLDAVLFVSVFCRIFAKILFF